MKKTFLIVGLLFSHLILTSQILYNRFYLNNVTVNRIDSNELRQGLWVHLNENGKPYIISNFKNDTLDGDYFEFYSNGKIEKCWEMKMGRLWNVKALFDTCGNFLDPGSVKIGNGVVKSYYPLDTIRIKKRDYSMLKYPSKVVWSETEYKNGLPDGKKYEYTTSGSLKFTYNIKPYDHLYDTVRVADDGSIYEIVTHGYFTVPPTYAFNYDHVVVAILDEKCEFEMFRYLRSYDLFIPKEYQTPERMKKLKKLRKYFKKEMDWSINYGY
ncbi:MAG: hypothetical protein V2A54_00645 [Bacteroidota bacterium]